MKAVTAIVAICAILAASVQPAEAVQAKLFHRTSRDSKHITAESSYAQVLRICNAYPYSAGGVNVLGSTLKYKACNDFTKTMHAGDQVDFYTAASVEAKNAGGKPELANLVGSFEVSEVPKNDALLLLVIQPHDSASTGVKFQSHVFVNSEDAQVALLDAFVTSGPAADAVTIADLKESDPTYAPRTEQLKFNTVVAVNPGSYEVFVPEEESKTKKTLDVTDGTKYSVIRVGVRSGSGVTDAIEYSEDLIVYPPVSGYSTAVMVGGAAAATAVVGLIGYLGYAKMFAGK